MLFLMLPKPLSCSFQGYCYLPIVFPVLSPPQRNEGSSWLWVRGKVKGMLGYPRAASVIEEFELKIQ